MAQYFPMDYLLFGLLTLYTFVCSMYGLVHLGIRVPCVTVLLTQALQFKKKKTLPQALLLGSVGMMLISLGASQELLTVLPRYTTFGPQSYIKDGEEVSCRLETFQAEHCTMSVSSSFFNK